MTRDKKAPRKAFIVKEDDIFGNDDDFKFD